KSLYYTRTRKSTFDECFFFSSWRRHPIFSRDWSSDVCSSDLVQFRGDHAAAGRASEARRRQVRLTRPQRTDHRNFVAGTISPTTDRKSVVQGKNGEPRVRHIIKKKYKTILLAT